MNAAEIEYVPKVGIVGPRGSGKTQLKVFLAYDVEAPPQYLRWLYGMPMYINVAPTELERMQAGSSNGNVAGILTHNGRRYQQVHTSGNSLKKIPVSYSNSRDEGFGKNFRADIYDFPGQAFSTAGAYSAGDPESPVEALAQCDCIVFVVPFWHLLPPPDFASLVEAGAIEEPMSQHNDIMAFDLDRWAAELQKLAGRDIGMTIALSQLGGETLRLYRTVLENRTAPVLTSLDRMIAAAIALEKIGASRKTVDELMTIPKVAYLVRCLARQRMLHDATYAYVDACAAAGNRSATVLQNLPWNPLFMAFNVVSGGQSVYLQQHAANCLAQEPMNVRLSLLPIWQGASRGRLW